MAFPPHMEVTEDYPEKFISVSAIGSPLSDSSDSNNFFSPPSFLPCPCLHIATLIVFQGTEPAPTCQELFTKEELEIWDDSDPS